MNFSLRICSGFHFFCINCAHKNHHHALSCQLHKLTVSFHDLFFCLYGYPFCVIHRRNAWMQALMQLCRFFACNFIFSFLSWACSHNDWFTVFRQATSLTYHNWHHIHTYIYIHNIVARYMSHCDFA